MPQRTLKTYFGYDQFRPGQLEIVESILAGRDTLAILPTGGGKSLCFQVPGLMLGGTTVVVSPLISLMKDQVDHLVVKGIAATYLNSSLAAEEARRRFTFFTQGKYHFMYVSPEKLRSAEFVKACQSLQIPLVAVDEAHCISQWGHDFRPEYRQIAEFIARLARRPAVAAFTASATSHTRQDIIHQLGLHQANEFVKSVKRDNLFWQTEFCPTRFHQQRQLLRLLKKNADQPAIIYLSTRAGTVQTSQFLNAMGFTSTFYHGGMDADTRTTVQEQFLGNRINIICATNAFGMGVDKPDVRMVIHTNLPANMEGYYQEAGRAGRDGDAALCALLTSPQDIETQQQLLQSRYPDPAVVADIMHQLAKKPSATAWQIFHALQYELSGKQFWSILHNLESRQVLEIKKSSAHSKSSTTFHLFHDYQDVLQQLFTLRKHELQRTAFMHSYVTNFECLARQQQQYFDEKTLTTTCSQCGRCTKQRIAPSAAEQERYAKLMRLHQQHHFPFLTKNTLKFLSVAGPACEQVPGFGKGLRDALSKAVTN